ncbi:MAG: ABC transporter ATP-binding protein [Candidatus Thermoplasmatota archaeon]
MEALDDTKKALTVNDLQKVYPQWRKEPTKAVDGISFSVDEGEIMGFLGPNGAGKTTTIKCICGLVEPTKGDINIFGIDAVNNTRRAVTNTSAVLEGNRNIYWRLTTRENLEFFARLHGRSIDEVESEIKSLLKRFDLQKKEDTPARKLSRGMQQKLALSCALIRGTDFLLLDEPTLGLDVKTSKELRGFIKQLTSKEGKTILLSSHDMNVVEDVCERVIIMNRGKILANDSVENLKDIFNVHLYDFIFEGEHELLDLEEKYNVTDIEQENGKTKLRVSLKDSDSFYDLVNHLQKKDIKLEEVKNLDKNMEEIFMDVIEKEEGVG